MDEKFHAAIRDFADSVRTKFDPRIQLPANPEDQLKTPIEGLFKAVGAIFSLSINTRTETPVVDLGGRPDVGVTVKNLLCGHVELKAPGVGANPNGFGGANKKQWEKFKALPNLIYTDGNEWALFRSGQKVGASVRFLGDITQDGADSVNVELANALELMLRDFLNWEPLSPTSPRELANMLAPLCRILRDEVLAAIGNPESPLKTLEAEWRQYLFRNTDDPQFADAYAQTLTYALLLAKFSGATTLSVDSAVQALAQGHGLLSQTLKILGDPQARPEIELPLDLLERVIEAVDVAKLTRKDRDPWLFFYEDFLAAYDPKLRKDRGVYYTPIAVVQTQVRLVAQLLKDKFNKPLAFAEEDVMFLDPAVGTGAYPLAAMQHGLDLALQRFGKGGVAGRATIIARNMHAFELLVGPYAVAHMRLTQEVLDAKGSPPEEGIQVFLTDTLESPYEQPPKFTDLAHRALTREHERAAKVKADTPILVCMGNPPYDRQTIDMEDAGTVMRKGGWIRYGDPAKKITPLLETFIKPVREAGQGVHIKNLYNDYVYFWRWALWKVFESNAGPGIVSFITASSYLKGPGFLGMREVMRRTFDNLWIIDLEGDNLGARKTENVFAIQIPVAIAIGVRYGKPNSDAPAKVHYCKITGKEAEKLAALEAISGFGDLDWQTCFSGWHEPFLPEGSGNYFAWPLVTDVFPWQHSGVETKRTWVISAHPETLEKRWVALLDFDKDKRADPFRETRDRKVYKKYRDLEGNELQPISHLKPNAKTPPLTPFGYRSFDRQWILHDSRVSDYLRPSLWVAHGDRQIYMTGILTDQVGLGPALTATIYIPDRHHFSGRGGKDIIPLWRDAEATEPNLTAGLVDKMEEAYGFSLKPEDILAYAYALLATPAYVERYSEELTIPGPRLPLTKNLDLFKRSVALGRRLIWLHTYGERMAPDGHAQGVVPQGQARNTVAVPEDREQYPEAFSYNEANKTLTVGSGAFAPVIKSVWEFSVSGLEVVRSWLRYRMKAGAGKKSSPLNDIRPEHWTFSEELLELLWVLEATVAMFPGLEANLEAIVASDLFTEGELPKPTEEEKKPPAVLRRSPEQVDLNLEE